MISHRRLVALTAASFVLIARHAAGQESPEPPLAVEVDDCLGSDREELVRRVLLELQDIDVEGAGARALRASVTCEGDAFVLRLVDDSGWEARRTVSADAPEASRSRLVALVLTEMVATRLLTPEAPPPVQVVVERVVVPGPAPAPVRIAASPPAWRVAAHVGARAFSRPRLVTRGAGIVVERELPGRFAVVADLAGESRRTRHELGHVDVTSVSLGAGPALRLDLRAACLTVSAGMRGGLAVLEGAPGEDVARSGRAVAGVWFGPTAGARGWMPVGPLLLSAGLEAGAVVRPVTGFVDGARAVAVDGLWVSATVAVGAEL